MEWDDLLAAAHVWQIRPDKIAADALERNCLGWLAPAEKAHWSRLRGDRLKHDYLAARGLVRITLSRYTGVEPEDWKFAKAQRGKPRIAGPAECKALQFNLTHTKDLIACVVTRAGEVGVDAEEITRAVDVEQVARHFLSEIEREHLAALPPRSRKKRFFEIWVLKEAYLKGRGTGLWQSPEKVTIRFDRRGLPRAMENWRFSLHQPTRQHVAAAAVRKSRARDAITISWFTMEDWP